jgi:all-trans-retinol dehydrogenase (NAD+)
MEGLKGKVVLVTGAARGMGKLEALNFAREGCRMIITDVDEAELAKTVEEMRSQGFEACHYVHDISRRDACFELAEKVESEVGPVDVLINNAGITENLAVLDLSEASLRRMMDVNYFGNTWMMQAFVPRASMRGRGHVVNICSVAGKVGNPLMGGYCATKHALVGITDTIRMELYGRGVRFTIVNPGYVKTGMFEGAKLPFITAWQTPQKVADAVLRAVQKNQAEVCVPAFDVRLIAFLRGLALPKLVDFMFHVLRQEKSMTTWKKDASRPF